MNFRLCGRFKFRNFSFVFQEKPFEKQIRPFNFMLIGSEKKDIIPCLPHRKDFNSIKYEKFVDYKSNTSFDKLPLPSTEYWYTLDDVLTQYVMHNDNKFDSDNEGISHRKHIIADWIRYIGKETNNLDKTQITGIDANDYLEYNNLMEFYNWILSLKPGDVKDKGISDRGLRNVKQKIRNGNGLKNRSKVIQILFKKT